MRIQTHRVATISWVGISVLVILFGITVSGIAASRGEWSGKTVKVLTWGEKWLFMPLIQDGVKQPFLKEFETETGINVEFHFFGEDVARTKAMLDCTSHTGKYDILAMGCWALAPFADAGYVEPLDGYIEKWADPKYFSLNDLLGSSIQANSYEGLFYSLPVYDLAAGIMYRKDLFRDMGLAIPQDMDELTTAAQVLTLDLNGDGKVDIYGITGRGRRGEEPAITSAGFAWAYGGNWFEHGAYTAKTIRDLKAKPTVDNPEFIAGIQKYAELLHKYGPPGNPNWGWVEASEAFARGKTAMYVSGNSIYWYAKSITTLDKDNFGVALAPRGPSGRRAQEFFSHSYGINADSENKRASWKVLQLIASSQIQKAQAKAGVTSLPKMSILLGAELRKIHPLKDLYILWEAMKLAQPEYMPKVREFVEINDIIGTATSRVIAGEITAEAALREANTEILDIMTSSGYYK
jgi:multiple sugar transport system substrate-binding protein